MSGEILEAVQQAPQEVLLALVCIAVGISAIWTAMQAVKAARIFAREIRGRSN